MNDPRDVPAPPGSPFSSPGAWTGTASLDGVAVSSASLPPGRPYVFTGGAGSWVLTCLLAWLLMAVTFGFGLPWALTLQERWKASHTFLYGRQLAFVGSGMGLIGQWIKWFLLILVTLGVYGFWVYPRLVRWVQENTVVDPNGQTLQH